MKQVMILLAGMAFSHAAFSQTIEMINGFGNTRFQQDTIVMTPRQVSELLSIDAQAADEFKRARMNSTFSAILGFSGGFLIAFPLGTAIAGGEPEWILAGAGVGLLLASIPLNRKFKSQAASALDRYNSLQPTSAIKPTVSFTSKGLTIGLKF